MNKRNDWSVYFFVDINLRMKWIINWSILFDFCRRLYRFRFSSIFEFSSSMNSWNQREHDTVDCCYNHIQSIIFFVCNKCENHEQSRFWVFELFIKINYQYHSISWKYSNFSKRHFYLSSIRNFSQFFAIQTFQFN